MAPPPPPGPPLVIEPPKALLLFPVIPVPPEFDRKEQAVTASEPALKMPPPFPLARDGVTFPAVLKLTSQLRNVRLPAL